MSDSKFPSGWRIEGLYREGKGVRSVDHDKVRSRDIIRADAIIVSYTNPDTGAKTYRNIHGATDKRQVGKLITDVTAVVSPV